MLRVEFIMRERGITQTDLAEITGIERVSINRVLRGTLPPYPKYRAAFADALHWEGDPAELFEHVRMVI